RDALEDGRPDVAPCYLHGALEDGRPDVAPCYRHGALDAGQWRDACAAAHVDEDAFGAEELIADTDRVGRIEPRGSLEHGPSPHTLEPGADPLTRICRDGVGSRLDALHVDVDTARSAHAVFGCPSRDVGGPRAGDQRLGRDAARVHACAAEEFALA